ncbi:MAG: hypothetical protein O3A01_05715, partial [bacterium]|nr:hypothetical protein [bacterium]
MDRLKPTSGAAAARYELSTQQGSSATVKSHSDGLVTTTRRRCHLLNRARNMTPKLPHSKYAQFAQSQLTGPKSNRSNLVQVRRGAAKFKTNHVDSARSVVYESKWQKDSPSAIGTTKFIAKGISSPAVFSKDVGNAWKSGSYARSVFTAVTGVVLGSVGVATAAASVGVGLAAGGAALAVKSVHAVGAGVVGAVTGVGYLLTQLGRGVCKGLSWIIGRGDRGPNMV